MLRRGGRARAGLPCAGQWLMPTRPRLKLAAVHLDGGRCDFAALEGVCIAHVSGVMLPGLYLKTIECAAHIIERHECTAGVIDCSRAAVMMTAKDFTDARRLWSAHVRATLHLPAAVVCPKPLLKTLRGVLWESVKGGYERALFTEPLAAWEWAKCRAREVRALRQDASDRGFGQSRPGER